MNIEITGKNGLYRQRPYRQRRQDLAPTKFELIEVKLYRNN